MCCLFMMIYFGVGGSQPSTKEGSMVILTIFSMDIYIYMVGPPNCPKFLV